MENDEIGTELAKLKNWKMSCVNSSRRYHMHTKISENLKLKMSSGK